MKQKIVIKVHIRCDKCRKKAMKVAAGARGVISVTIQGNERDEIVVIGNEMDSAGLCTVLRKKLGGANLMSVEEVKPPKPEEKPAEKKSGEKKPEEEAKKQEHQKEGEKKEAKISESKPPTQEATIIYHHYPPNYPPPNYCYPNHPPQCYVVTTQYEDYANCTIM